MKLDNLKQLVKVNYTTVNKDILLNHINGVPIPLNPVLNSNNIYYNQPLYIYVLPKNIYKKQNIQEIELFFVISKLKKIISFI